MCRDILEDFRRFSAIQRTHGLILLLPYCSFKDSEAEKELSELFDKPTAYGLTVTHESTHRCAHTVKATSVCVKCRLLCTRVLYQSQNHPLWKIWDTTRNPSIWAEENPVCLNSWARGGCLWHRTSSKVKLTLRWIELKGNWKKNKLKTLFSFIQDLSTHSKLFYNKVKKEFDVASGLFVLGQHHLWRANLL